MIIDSAEYTCAGGHSVNEDSYLCSRERGLFIVADGLGGHSDGEVASSAAIGYFKENCFGGYTDERITELMEGANTEVLNKGDGGKTTVAAAFIENGRFVYANAGDSRVYFFRGNKLTAQTKDHSVCQASVDMGLIRPEDIRGSEDRARLLKVLGSEEKLNIKKHYQPIKLENGDAFLICSDGFWDYVYESEMEADLLKSDSADVWLKYMLKRHILRGQNKGDNYTAVCGIIHIDKDEVFEDIPYVKDMPKTTEKKKKKDRSANTAVLAAAIIAVVAVIAVIAAVVLLKSRGGDGEDQNDLKQSAAVLSETSPPPNENSFTSPTSATSELLASVTEEITTAYESSSSETSETSEMTGTSETSDTSEASETSDTSETSGSSDLSGPPSETTAENDIGREHLSV